MLSFITRKFLEFALTLTAALVVVFVALRLMPGDPIRMLLDEQAGSPPLLDRWRGEFGLTGTLSAQFLDYAGRLLSGDFGRSLRYPDATVAELLAEPIAITLFLSIAATALALVVGISSGAVAALRPGGRLDSAVTATAVVGLSTPGVVFAALSTYLFAFKLGWLPVAGWVEPRHAVMPVLVLALPFAAYTARITRTAIADKLREDYVRTAAAKGASIGRILLHHALPNAAAPLLVTMAAVFGAVLTTTALVETFFNIPGAGRIAVQSTLARDYPAVMALSLFFTFCYMLVHAAVDIASAAIDPRIRPS